MRRLAAATLLLLLLLGALALMLSRGSYSVQDRDTLMVGFTVDHWAGTDELGRDRLVRVCVAVVIGLLGAATAAGITTAIAAGVGLLAAFSHTIFASTLMLLSDLFLTLPWLFLLMMVRAGLSLTTTPMNSAVITFAVLAILGWPACARAVFHGASVLRSSECILQGRASGLRRDQLARLHVLPHLMPLLLPQFLVCIPAFIVAEANLGTLGLGIAEPVPSWGAMLLEMSNSALLARSDWVYLPILLLVVTLILLEALATET